MMEPKRTLRDGSFGIYLNMRDARHLPDRFWRRASGSTGFAGTAGILPGGCQTSNGNSWRKRMACMHDVWRGRRKKHARMYVPFPAAEKPDDFMTRVALLVQGPK